MVRTSTDDEAFARRFVVRSAVPREVLLPSCLPSRFCSDFCSVCSIFPSARAVGFPRRSCCSPSPQGFCFRLLKFCTHTSAAHTTAAMPDVRPHHQQGGATPGHWGQAAVQAEALLAGVLAAAKAALPEGLDLLVWGASRVGDQATLRHLLANGGGSSWTPSSDDERWGRDSCLRVASRFGHEGAVKELLETGVDVDEDRADNGVTPLYLAALEGHEGVVEQLMKAGADVNKERTDTGTTPLCIAAEQGHEGVVEQLLKAGADVNKATDEGATPLWIAADKGHEGMVEKLLKAGADLDTELNPLISASYYGFSRVCSLLLEAGANVNYVTSEGAPLSVAVRRGHRDVALVLMEHGASSGDERLTPQMLKDLNMWMAEALQENRRMVAEKNRQMEEMVQRIPEWCAQAASAVFADDGKNDGSSRSPPAEV